MEHMNDSFWVLVIVACVALLLFRSRWVREFVADLAAQIQEAFDNFPRGGPPTPMHPSPAGDDALLRRASKKAEK